MSDRRLEAGRMRRELPNAIYRVDRSGRVDRVATEELVPDPNGLAFSPDFKRLYVASTGRGPGDTHQGGRGDLHVFDVTGDNRLDRPSAVLGLHGRRRSMRA